MKTNKVIGHDEIHIRAIQVEYYRIDSNFSDRLAGQAVQTEISLVLKRGYTVAILSACSYRTTKAV